MVISRQDLLVENSGQEEGHINLATLGHVDHGKTSLCSASSLVLSKILTGTTDRYVPFGKLDKTAEEQQRGITINTAVVEIWGKRRRYIVIDCPGHRDFIKNMIAGAAQVDAAILVVSAVDGPAPQTAEHLLLSKNLGVRYVVVFLNKVDLVQGDEELLEVVELEVRDLLSRYGYEDSPVVRGSALGALNGEPQWENSIVELYDTIDAYVPAPERPVDKPFKFVVESVLSKEGRGTVVAGQVREGRIKALDVVDMIEGDIVRPGQVVTEVQAFRKKLDGAKAGDNVGLLLRGVKKDEVSRGGMLCAPGAVRPHRDFRAEVVVLTHGEGGRSTSFKVGFRPQFFFSVNGITGDIVEATDMSGQSVEQVDPGSTVTLRIKLIRGATIEKGATFVMREGHITVASGRVSEIVE